MPVVSLTSAESVANYAPADRLKPVRIWLYIVALMVLAMVVVGGITRLTHSGLSITEWEPISGAIPPLNAADWQAEFEHYQQIPQYKLLNLGMSLDDFRFIFWWEWAHRFLARVIGFVFAIPFLVWARAARAHYAIDGIGMLVEQAAEAFRLWHGVRPYTDEAYAALRERDALLVTAD